MRFVVAVALAGCGRVDFDAVLDGSADGVRDDDSGIAHCASLASPAQLCADFDTGEPIEMGFDRIDRSPEDQTTSAVLDSLAFSGSSSAKQSLSSAGSCSYTRLVRDFASGGGGLSVRFRMRVSAPWPDEAIFANVNFGDTVRCRLLPRLGPSGASSRLQVQWGMPQQDEFHDLSLAPALDSWSLVEMILSDVAGTPHVEVHVDSTVALSVDLPQCIFGGVAFVGFGLYCANGTHEIRYDDVVVDHP